MQVLLTGSIPCGRVILNVDSGRTRYARLYLIGTTSTVLAVDALKGAMTEAKAGNDVQRYVDAVAALRLHLAPGDQDGNIDQAWIERKEKQNKTESTRLEAELKGYKNNLIKESIRVSPPLTVSRYACCLILTSFRWAMKTSEHIIMPSETSTQQ